MKKSSLAVQIVLLLTLALLLPVLAAARSGARSSTSKTSGAAKITDGSAAPKKVSKSRKTRRTRRGRRRRWRERFFTSSYDDQNSAGDLTAGEDPIVRAAALEALGNMNGTVVAIDPSTGRILAMVNQKLALGEGAIPCSTIKVPVALAALSEGLVTKDEPIKLGRRWRVNLTSAIATSNNGYFEVLGRRLGFDKYSHYARLYGLGEMAGYNIEGEHLGVFPDEELPRQRGGVGRMCSFGEGIAVTPLQLGALVSAIANGGTLYYLQHPRTMEEVAAFQPMMKRELDISAITPDLLEGLSGAVEFGTARTVRYNFIEEPVLGKTGTCSQDGTRYGWFASYTNTQSGRIVTVVMLRGGWPTYGPRAAEIAGRIYRNLYDNAFFAGAPATAASHASRLTSASQ